MLLAMLLVGAGTLSSSYVSRQSSPVWDETHFFGIGNYLLETGRFDIPGIGIHPPVAHYLGSLALLGERIPLSEFGALGKKDPRTRLARAHVKRGNALLRRVGFERFLQARWPFIVLYGVAGLLVFPYPRSYVNPVTARGPGYEHLADMDLDWGGGLVALRRYIAKEHVRDFAFSYHGSVEPAIFGIYPSWYENPSRMVFSRGTLPSKGLLFVSSTNLSGVYGGVGPYLRGRRPVTVVGGTIYVFRIEGLGLDRRGEQR